MDQPSPAARSEGCLGSGGGVVSDVVSDVDTALVFCGGSLRLTGTVLFFSLAVNSAFCWCWFISEFISNPPFRAVCERLEIRDRREALQSPPSFGCGGR